MQISGTSASTTSLQPNSLPATPSHIACRSSSPSLLHPPSVDYKCSRRASATSPVTNSEAPSNLSRSTLGPGFELRTLSASPHPGRRAHASRLLTTPSSKHLRTPTSLTGGNRPRSSQPSFRSRLCHWPKARILPHHSNPILFQSQTTHPTHTTPSPHLHLFQPNLTLYLIQTQDHPRPVPTTAPVNLPHSQRHPATTSVPAKPNSGPLRIVPSPVFVQARGLPAPATHPDQGQPNSSMKLICPCMSYRRGPTCPKERGVAGPAALVDLVSAPLGLGTSPESNSAREPQACLKCRRANLSCPTYRARKLPHLQITKPVADPVDGACMNSRREEI